MAYALDPAQPLPDELRRVAHERLDEAILYLTASDEPFAVRVHEARKRTKELRALLRLVRKPMGNRRYRAENHRLRDAARRLAPSREAYMVSQTLQAVDEGAPDLVPLREEFDRRHRSARASAAGARVTEAVAGELAEARQQIAGWPLPSDDWDLIDAGVRREYRRGRRRLREAKAHPTDAALHEWRKRGKDLWYHLRLLAPSFPAPLDALAEEAHRLSETLGEDHDLAVLTGTLNEIVDADDDVLPPPARERLEKRVSERRWELQAQAWQVGERLYAAKPGVHGRLLASWWTAARRSAE